ncbi:MAG TPA: histidine phosphatase family protein [Actinomycetes bacterium]|nr:histidine phosphatase family protein [Actinomycetes bacterium]
MFVSDLLRAVETTEIAFPDGQIPIHQDARLRECNYGELNGCPGHPPGHRAGPTHRRALPGRSELPAGPRRHRCLPARAGHTLEPQPDPGDRPLGQQMGARLPAHRSLAARPGPSALQLAAGVELHAARGLARP